LAVSFPQSTVSQKLCETVKQPNRNPLSANPLLQKVFLLPQPHFLSALINREAQGQVLNNQSGGVENGDLLPALPPRFLSRGHFSQRAIHLFGLELPPAQGHVDFAGMGGLGPIVHYDLGRLEDGRVQLLLARGIGADGVDMGPGRDPPPGL